MTGQEINEAVARKLGKYPLDETIAYWKSQVTGAGTFNVIIANYSSDISDAWKIIEFVKDKKLEASIAVEGNNFVCQFWDKKKKDWLAHGTNAKTAPMAIALAFLKLNV